MRSRTAIVELARSWLGKNEADGSFKEIIDIYNSHRPLARGTLMQYDWHWCACTISALAIKLGYTDIVPIEISCPQMVAIAQRMGIWQEDDRYTPLPGDIILYDWQDSGVGDNKGTPDHIGIVEVVAGGKLTVIEGNCNEAVRRRTLLVNGRYIRGYIVPKYDAETATKTATAAQGKTVEQLAREVMDGKWGSGSDRKARLTAAGYDYTAVQAEVNRLYKERGRKLKPLDVVAQEVIQGLQGSGDARRRKLRAAGYDPDAVQLKVNALLR